MLAHEDDGVQVAEGRLEEQPRDDGEADDGVILPYLYATLLALLGSEQYDKVENPHGCVKSVLISCFGP